MGEVWKVVGTCPELGRMQPAIAPSMRWTEGNVWVMEARLREGTHFFKFVLRNSEGAYIWEDGSDRDVIIRQDHNEHDCFTIDMAEPKMPYRHN